MVGIPPVDVVVVVVGIPPVDVVDVSPSMVVVVLESGATSIKTTQSTTTPSPTAPSEAYQ